MIRRIGLAVIVLMLAFLVLLNVRLRSPGNERTVEAQLRHLERVLGEGAAEEMQSMFPEGYVFTWALYGLASAEHARQLERNDARRAHYLGESRRALTKLQSETARSTFTADMKPPYGAFYNAWTLYLNASYLRAAGRAGVPITDLHDFTARSDRFAMALLESPSPFLDSYRGACWPADTPPGVAALAIHDKIIGSRYEAVVERWVRAARERLEPPLHALSHSAEPGTGRARSLTRGGSLALMSRVLVDVDDTFAREQYAILREHFLDDVLGVPGMREYPRGVEGVEDVDSGPIIFGFSGPAIVVGAAAARANGDHAVSEGLLGTTELIGLPLERGRCRFYAGGVVPVGDAFIAWARATLLDRVDAWAPIEATWYLPFHVLSGVIAALLVWQGLRLVRPRADVLEDVR